MAVFINFAVYFYIYIFFLLFLRAKVSARGPRERISQVGLRRNIRAEDNNRPLALVRYQQCYARTTASAEWAGASVQGHMLRYESHHEVQSHSLYY